MSRVWRSLDLAARGLRRPGRPAPGLRSVAGICLAIACAALTSCGGELRLVPPATPSPQLTPAARTGSLATPVSTAVPTKFGEVVWATAIDPRTSAPLETVASYSPDAPEIIAAMQSFALTAGSVIESTWEYNNTSLDAFSTRLVPTTSVGESWISFHIERGRDMPWPAGIYELTVSLNGTTVQQASVEVRD